MQSPPFKKITSWLLVSATELLANRARWDVARGVVASLIAVIVTVVISEPEGFHAA